MRRKGNCSSKYMRKMGFVFVKRIRNVKVWVCGGDKPNFVAITENERLNRTVWVSKGTERISGFELPVWADIYDHMPLILKTLEECPELILDVKPDWGVTDVFDGASIPCVTVHLNIREVA